MNAMVEQMIIPLIMFVLCLYYGIRMILTKDVSSILGKEKKNLKNEIEYAKAAGKLIILLGVASLVMGIISIFNTYASLIIIIISVLIMGVLWKKMNDKYGV